MRSAAAYASRPPTALLAAVALLNAACGMREPAVPPGGMKVGRLDLYEAVSQTGEVRPARQVELKSEASGLISRVHVSEGQTVDPGDTVLSIDRTQLNLEHAGLELSIRKLELEREKLLREVESHRAQIRVGAVSRNRLQDLETDLSIQDIQLRQQRLQLQDIRRKLSKCTVLSPIHGSVIDLNVEAGEIAVSAIAGFQNGTPIATIADLSRLEVESQVGEADYPHLAKGQKVVLRSATVDGVRSSGTIAYISLTSRKKPGQEVGVFKVVISVDSSMAGLAPGVGIYVDYVILDRKAVLGVPFAFVTRRGSRAYVFGIPMDAPAGTQSSYMPVELGETDYKSYEIKSGVQEGALIFPPDGVTPSGSRG